jgi:hypothetical protein
MRFIAVVLCLSLRMFAAEMSHEETIVRTAYLKVAYASKQNAMLPVAKEWWLPEKLRTLPPQDAASINARVAASEVTLTLKDFVIGNVTDILSKKVSDVVSPPQDTILRSSLHGYDFTEQGGKAQPFNGIELRWEKNNFPSGPESDAITFDDVYKLQWGVERPPKQWETYATYTVTITYKGRTAGPYRTMFVFGHDENGNFVAQPLDPTTDNVALANAMHEPLFPAALVATKMRSIPAALGWVTASEVTNSSCSVGKNDVCCDLAAMKCGPNHADVSAALSRQQEVGQ